MDCCEARVKEVVVKGLGGPYAIATPINRSDIDGSIIFSLDSSVWEERKWPEVGSVVVLGKLRREDAGWRAKEGRFWKPSDT